MAAETVSSMGPLRQMIRSWKQRGGGRSQRRRARGLASGARLRTCNSLEKMSAALMHHHQQALFPRRIGNLLSDAHVLQPPDCIYQRMSWLALGWLGRTVTSVIYGMGIEAAGGDAPARLGNWEKLRLRVVAMPLRRRHAALWLFMTATD